MCTTWLVVLGGVTKLALMLLPLCCDCFVPAAVSNKLLRIEILYVVAKIDIHLVVIEAYCNVIHRFSL